MKYYITSYEMLRDFIEYDLFYFNIEFHKYKNGYNNKNDYLKYSYSFTNAINLYNRLFVEYHFKITYNKIFDDFEIIVFKKKKQIDVIK